MFSCFLSKESFLFISELCKHFQIKHVTHNFLEYTSVKLNCNRSFNLLNSFKKHLATHFTPTVIEKSNIITSVDTTLIKSNGSITNPFSTITEKSSSTTVLNNFDDIRLTDNHIGQFLASLYSNSQIPRNVIQLVIEGMADIIEGIKYSLLKCSLTIPDNILII